MIEVEYKFEVKDLKELKDSLSRLGLKLAKAKKITDTYYDTEDMGLRDQGCLLRERKKGGKTFSTIKTRRFGAVSVTRPELEKETALKGFHKDATKFAARYNTVLPNLEELRPVCVIEKRVEGYKTGALNLTIDEGVTGTLGGKRYSLGDFMEIEAPVEEDVDIDSTEKKILAFAKALPARLVTATYQDMLFEKVKK